MDHAELEKYLSGLFEELVSADNAIWITFAGLLDAKGIVSAEDIHKAMQLTLDGRKAGEPLQTPFSNSRPDVQKIAMLVDTLAILANVTSKQPEDARPAWSPQILDGGKGDGETSED